MSSALTPPPPLVSAVRSRDLAGLSALLTGGEDVDAAGADGRTALHHAAWRRYVPLATIAQLLSPANLSLPDARGLSPLHIAVGSKRWPLVALLVARGGDVNFADAQGRTPLHRGLQKAHLPQAILSLLASSVNVNLADADGRTPVHLAVLKQPPDAGQPTRASQVLHRQLEAFLELGADVNLQDRHGCVPAVYAVDRRVSAETFRLLVTSKNVNCGTQNVNCGTQNVRLLLRCLVARRPDLVRPLLSHGADIDSIVLYRHRRELPVTVALEKGCPEDVLRLLVSDHNINLAVKEARGDEPRVLNAAVLHEAWGFVKHLVRAGADVDGLYGRSTALHAACMRPNTPRHVFLMLMTENNVNKRDDVHRLPIEYALTAHNAPALEVLLASGSQCTLRLMIRTVSTVKDLQALRAMLQYLPTGFPLVQKMCFKRERYSISVNVNRYIDTPVLHPRRHSKFMEYVVHLVTNTYTFAHNCHVEFKVVDDRNFAELEDRLISLLEEAIKTPYRLKLLCTFCIRNCLKDKTASSYESLGLPPLLVSFVKLETLACELHDILSE